VQIKLAKIQKRLGSELYGELQTLFLEAVQAYGKEPKSSYFHEFIEKLLVRYYDPMYDYQISKASMSILFRGNKDEVLQYLKLASL